MRGANTIEQFDHIAVKRFLIAADENLRVVIAVIKLKQLGHDIAIGHNFLIEMNEPVGINPQTGEIFFPRRSGLRHRD